MKFALSLAVLATAVTSAAATFTIISPWGQTTWTAGDVGIVQWNATADEAGKKCEIHLLTGTTSALTFVANFTANGNLVPCDYTQANLHPLPDYPSGTYSIRFGENGGNTDLYAYSGTFQFVGNGTAQLPQVTASAAPAPAAAAAVPGAV